MNSLLLGLLALAGGWTIENICIAIVVVCGAVGVVLILCKVFGVTIPPWMVQIFWIVVAVVIGVAAIRFIFSQ